MSPAQWGFYQGGKLPSVSHRLVNFRQVKISQRCLSCMCAASTGLLVECELNRHAHSFVLHNRHMIWQLELNQLWLHKGLRDEFITQTHFVIISFRPVHFIHLCVTDEMQAIVYSLLFIWNMTLILSHHELSFPSVIQHFTFKRQLLYCLF